MKNHFKAAFVAMSNGGFTCLTDQSQQHLTDEDLRAIAEANLVPSVRARAEGVEVGFWSDTNLYKCVWGESYCIPGESVKRLMFFTEAIGYMADDLDLILQLSIGQKAFMDLGDHTVERIA